MASQTKFFFSVDLVNQISCIKNVKRITFNLDSLSSLSSMKFTSNFPFSQYWRIYYPVKIFCLPATPPRPLYSPSLHTLYPNYRSHNIDSLGVKFWDFSQTINKLSLFSQYCSCTVHWRHFVPPFFSHWLPPLSPSIAIVSKLQRSQYWLSGPRPCVLNDLMHTKTNTLVHGTYLFTNTCIQIQIICMYTSSILILTKKKRMPLNNIEIFSAK